MSFIEIVSGQRQRWGLVSKLGEGDAGEVFLVESLLERKPAILKRPHRSAFANDVMRQASQIKNEGDILALLVGRLHAARLQNVCVPALLDQSPGGAEMGDKAFIVIEKAAGIDLGELSRWMRFPPGEDELGRLTPTSRTMAERLFTHVELPEPFLLRTLFKVLEVFDAIHATSRESDSGGFLWNDVKPEHLFWEPTRGCLTIIDWGNSQVLTPDGSSKDRRFSAMDDRRQFLEETGRFTLEYAAALHRNLDWPSDGLPAGEILEQYQALKERIRLNWLEYEARLRDQLRKEADFLAITAPDAEQIGDLIALQAILLDYGTSPAANATNALHTRFALRLANDEDLERFHQAVLQAIKTDPENYPKWQLLEQITVHETSDTPRARKRTSRALVFALNDDWPACLWELFALENVDNVSDWWVSIAGQIRNHYLGLNQDAITPYVAATRLFYTLQSLALQSPPSDPGNAATLAAILPTYQEEVLKKWRQLEPAPPNSGIDYSGLDQLLEEIEAFSPGARENMEKILSQARAQVQIVHSVWREKEFETARRGLRQAFIWDPDRIRLMQADRALQHTPQWLLRLRQGTEGGEPFPDFLTEVELEGREIRNQIGPAPWLDLILETLKQLRNGGRPVDLLMNHPELLTDIPWLSEYRSRETITLPRQASLNFERRSHPSGGTGNRTETEGVLGTNQDLHLTDSLDTWLPEARGSSARVFSGKFKNAAEPFAVKVMRHDRLEYALPLFREEAQILSILRDVPGVTPLLESGFIKLQTGVTLPGEDRSASAAGLRGDVIRFGPEQTQNFLALLDRQANMGWLPYLVMEKRKPADNLIMYCDAGHTRGWFLPLRESLFLAIQICDILQIAHDRNIVYRDHKILHFYWDAGEGGVVTIDWNIARRHPEGLTPAERQFDLVQFGARALHHILTGRPAPGALPLGPNRPEDIEQSAHQYAVRWTYDDERLPKRVKEIIEGVLTEGYSSVRDLRQDLFTIYSQIPEVPSEEGA